MTEIFSIEQFQSALPVDKQTHQQLWEGPAVLYGELTYSLEVNEAVTILIMSSIRDGMTHCDGTGKNSIRAWLADALDLTQPLAGKDKRWIARTVNWRDNLNDTIRNLWRVGVQLGSCPKCNHQTTHYLKVKKDGPNKDRHFIACPDRECGYFKWAEKGEPQ